MLTAQSYYTGVKLPDPPSIRSDSITTPLTVDALSTLAREKEENSVAAAFTSDALTSSTAAADAALEAELGHLELNEDAVEGAATETTDSAIDIGEDYGLHAPPAPSKPFDLWSLISGKQYVLLVLVFYKHSADLVSPAVTKPSSTRSPASTSNRQLPTPRALMTKTTSPLRPSWRRSVLPDKPSKRLVSAEKRKVAALLASSSS